MSLTETFFGLAGLAYVVDLQLTYFIDIQTLSDVDIVGLAYIVDIQT